MPPIPGHERFSDDDGSIPLQLAAEANSAANHVREDFAAYRVEQGRTNESMRSLVANVHRGLAAKIETVSGDVASLRGELNGAARSTKNWLTLVGLVVGLLAAAAPFIEKALR